jgi:hypothetical protein
MQSSLAWERLDYSIVNVFVDTESAYSEEAFKIRETKLTAFLRMPVWKQTGICFVIAVPVVIGSAFFPGSPVALPVAVCALAFFGLSFLILSFLWMVRKRP